MATSAVIGVANPGFELDTEPGLEMQENQTKIEKDVTSNNTNITNSTINGTLNASNNASLGVKLSFLERFFTPKWLLLLLCWAATVQGIVVNGLVNVVVSTLERRFGLRSSETGLVAGSYDLGSMIAVIPVTYFGSRNNASKPRYIALGLLVMATGSLVFASPHFLTGPNPLPSSSTVSASSFCSESPNLPANCSTQSLSSLSNFKYSFLLGQMLHGMGAAPLITLGTTLLDESVSKSSSPLYIGILQAMFVVGPALGFVMGGQLLDIYTDIDKIQELSIELTPQSPLWVGAWWIGFIISAILAFIGALFLLPFPAAVKGSQKSSSDSNPQQLEGLSKALVELLVNKTYVLITLGGAMDGFTVAGCSAFLAKYMEAQFGLSAAKSAILVGLIVVPGGGGGTLLGGYLTKKLKLSRSGVIRMYVWCQVIAVPALLGFLINCPELKFVGINHALEKSVDLSQNKLENQFESECNSGCGCSPAVFDPICSSNELMFLNPCFAGCQSINNESYYNNCKCIEIGQRGQCEVDCQLLIPFAISLFVFTFVSFAAAMPNVVATLRAVEPHNRSIALGVASIFLRVLGTIPGPVVLGVLLDQTCLLWETLECEDGDAGNCWFYDKSSMGLAMLSVVVPKMIGALCYALALYYSRRSHIKDDIDT